MARLLRAFAILLLVMTGAFAAQPPKDYPNKQGDTYNFSGQRWYSQFKPVQYAVYVMDHQMVRVQINRGDYSWIDNRPGQTNRERSEFSCGCTVPFGKAVTFETDVNVEPGPVNDRYYQIIYQVHADDNVIGSPVVSINIQPSVDRTFEFIRVDAMYATGPSPANNVARTFPSAGQNGPVFVRGVLHHLKVVFVDGHGTATGSIHVEWDGNVILDQQNIVTGYVDAINPSYPKFGLYTGHPVQVSDTSLVAEFNGPDITIAP